MERDLNASLMAVNQLNVYTKKCQAFEHVWGHTGHRPYRCGVNGCDYGSRRKDQLMSHSLTHRREKPKKWAISDFELRTDKDCSIKSHLKAKHNDTDERCVNGRQSEKTLEERIERADKWLIRIMTPKGRRIKCAFNDCHSPSLFRDKSDALAHVWGHTGDRPYKCGVNGCDYDCRWKHLVKKHWQIRHSGEKPHKCPISDCDFRAAVYCNLKYHMKTKHNNNNVSDHNIVNHNSDTDNGCVSEQHSDMIIENNIETAKKWITKFGDSRESVDNKFEARLIQASVLKKILDAIKDLVTDASLDCSPSGMSMRAKDISGISQVEVRLNSDGFDKYHCDRDITLGVDLTSLSTVMKCAANEDSVTIKANDGDRKIILVFETPNGAKLLEYETERMDLDEEYYAIPDTNYSVNFEMSANEFERICRDLSQIGDALTISCVKNGLRFAASGQLGSRSISLWQNAGSDRPEEAVVVRMREAIVQSFALKYLNHFANATPLSTRVSLSMSPDLPLLVEYNINDSDEHNPSSIPYIRYYLAPNVDD